MSNRDAYIEKMKSNLDKLNEDIKELEGRGKQARESAREKYDEQMDKLRAQSKQAESKLAELKAAGADRWESMVAEMEKVRDAFVHSFSYFKSQL